MKIHVKDRTAKAVINTDLYSSEAVISAANDFTDGFWVYLDNDLTGKMTISLTPKSDDVKPELAAYEFFNYVLGTMQNG